jgi:hypothetical protein
VDSVARIEVLVVAATGGALGVILAIDGMKVISRLLFAVSPADPLTLAAAFFALIAAASAAALVPARRTARLSCSSDRASGREPLPGLLISGPSNIPGRVERACVDQDPAPAPKEYPAALTD